jgi:hypothetical protein
MREGSLHPMNAGLLQWTIVRYRILDRCFLTSGYRQASRLNKPKNLVQLPTQSWIESISYLGNFVPWKYSAAEWTPDAHLRHSSFAGLRDDKNRNRS